MGKRGRPRYPDVLTPREQEVLALVREGLTNGEIAERLSVSADTVKTHVSQILSKLGVGTREEAAAWAPDAEGEGWTWRRWVIAGLGTAVVVGAALVLGLLAWGVIQSNDGGENRAVIAVPTPTGTEAPIPTAVPPSPVIPSASGAWADCPELAVEALPQGLHLMDRATCELRSLTSADNVTSLAWSPDGEWIAYLRLDGFANPAPPSELMLAAADGSGIRQLTDTPGVSEGGPVWSPSGTRLAYSTVEQARDTVAGTANNDRVSKHDLLIMDVRTGETRTVLDDQACLGSYYWTSDEHHLLLDGCTPAVGLVDIETGGNEWLPEVTGVLAVHPTDDLVAFKCAAPIPQPRLSGNGVCLGKTDGSLPGLPINQSQFSNASPFSPLSQADSAILAYDAAWIDGGRALVLIDWGFYVLPMDGTPGRHFDDWRGSFIYWASSDVVVSSGCRQPDPNSSVIPCPNYELTSYNLNTGETRVTLTHGCGAGGTWSPDGESLAITTIQPPCPG